MEFASISKSLLPLDILEEDEGEDGDTLSGL